MNRSSGSRQSGFAFTACFSRGAFDQAIAVQQSGRGHVYSVDGPKAHREKQAVNANPLCREPELRVHCGSLILDASFRTLHFQPRWILIRIQTPDAAVVKVLQQFRVAEWPRVPSPNHLRCINARVVIDPFVIQIVPGTVLMMTMCCPGEACNFRKIAARSRLPRGHGGSICAPGHGGNAQYDQRAADYRYRADDGRAERAASPGPQPEVTHALHQGQIQQAGSSGEIVWRSLRFQPLSPAEAALLPAMGIVCGGREMSRAASGVEA